ncbi:MAG: hypothetical protein ACOY0T_29280 [Myxococcota bacterium]
MHDPVLAAVANNAAWCEAVCSAHGVPGEFHDGYWVNWGKVPAYTSKLIALNDGQRAAQLEAIRELMKRDRAQGFSVKDAFQSLDLGSLGFEELFRASWIQRDVSDVPRDSAERLSWSPVRDESELAAWEHAWRGSSANEDAPSERVFPASLLRSGVTFLSGERQGVTVATAALLRTGDVVGLCNVFSAVADVGPLYPGCARLAHELYPGLALVGYERGAALSGAERAGFRRLADLTVWLLRRTG